MTVTDRPALRAARSPGRRRPTGPWWRPRPATLVAFGGVGALAYVVDLGVYTLVRATVLDGSPIWSKVVSTSVATVVAWLGNRRLAFADGRRDTPVREAALFAAVNVAGLLVAAACLFVSHYVLGLTSQLADTVSGSVVGLVLGTAVRWLGYRHLVFPVRPSARPGGRP